MQNQANMARSILNEKVSVHRRLHSLTSLHIRLLRRNELELTAISIRDDPERSRIPLLVSGLEGL